jgi:hypothetical protein
MVNRADSISHKGKGTDDPFPEHFCIYLQLHPAQYYTFTRSILECYWLDNGKLTSDMLMRFHQSENEWGERNWDEMLDWIWRAFYKQCWCLLLHKALSRHAVNSCHTMLSAFVRGPCDQQIVQYIKDTLANWMAHTGCWCSANIYTHASMILVLDSLEVV